MVGCRDEQSSIKIELIKLIDIIRLIRLISEVLSVNSVGYGFEFFFRLTELTEFKKPIKIKSKYL